MQDATFQAIQRGRPGEQNAVGTPEQGGGQNNGVPPDDGSTGGGLPTGLSDADRVALDDYTGPGYRDMNSYLRNPDQFSPAEQAAIQARVDNVSDALAKVPPQPGTTYRGADLPDAVLARYQPGQIIPEDAFTSTSRNTDVAQGAFDGNVLFTVTGRNGRDVAPYSQFPHEAEILYDYGTEFKVVGKEWDPDLGKWLIDLVEV